MHRTLFSPAVYGFVPYIIRANGRVLGLVYGDPHLVNNRAPMMRNVSHDAHYYIFDLPFYQPQSFGL